MIGIVLCNQTSVWNDRWFSPILKGNEFKNFFVKQDLRHKNN